MVDEVNATPLTGVVSINVLCQGVCAVMLDGSLTCWGAGAGDVAVPLSLGGVPVQDVAMQTSCGSNDIRTSLRSLTTDNLLRHATTTFPQQCP